MRFIKSQVVEIDVKAERARIAEFFEPDAAQPVLRMLAALESGDLHAASGLFTQNMAVTVAAPVAEVIAAYRNHQKDPEPYEPPKLQPDATAGNFSNPNDVRVQHSYALHVLHAHRYALAKMAVLLQEVAGDDVAAQEQIRRAVGTLRAANGAAENDAFRLEEGDGKLVLSLD